MSDTHDLSAADETVRRLLVEIESTAPAPDDLEDRLLAGLRKSPSAGTMHRPLRRVVGAVLVAAAVAALAVAVAVRSNDTSPQPTGPASTSRSLGFALRGSGTRLASVAATYDTTDPLWAAQVSSRRGFYSVFVHPARRGLQGSTAGTRRVTIGRTTGWYGCVDGSGKLTPNRPSCTHTVVWRYRPGGYAEVRLLGGFDSSTDLLRVARSINLAATTPVRSAIALPAPAGMDLITASSLYRSVPGLTTEATTQVQFRTGGSSSSATSTKTLVVQLVRGGRSTLATAGWSGGGVPMTVAGRSAHWRADDHTLAVQWAPRVWLLLTANSDVPLSTMRELVASTHVTPHLDNPSQWFDANDTFR
jgi:hypothetical protein